MFTIPVYPSVSLVFYWVEIIIIKNDLSLYCDQISAVDFISMSHYTHHSGGSYFVLGSDDDKLCDGRMDIKVQFLVYISLVAASY